MTVNAIKKHMVDRDYRYRLQSVAVPLLIGIVSFVLAAVEYFHYDGAPTLVHFVFGFGVVNVVFSVFHYFVRKFYVFSHYIYMAICTLMTVFLLMHGPMEAVFWVLLIPAFSAFMFGSKRGSIFGAAFLLVVIFFMWTPVGNRLLLCDYGETFRTRFPIICVGFSLISLLFVFMRQMTYDALVDAKQALWEISIRDGMTGVSNHARFTHDLDALMEDETAKSVGFIYVDINGLKQINDTQSHDAGDHMIYCCADILKKHFDGRICYRVGGDEFIVLLKDVSRREFYSKLNSLRVDFDDSKDVSVAIGAEYSEDVKNASAAVLAADSNMQSNKAAYYAEHGIERRDRRRSENG